MVTKKIELKVWENNHVNVYTNRGEVDSRYIDVIFKNQDESKLNLSEKTVTFYALKPDGTKIFNQCNINTETNTASVMLTSQVLSTAGCLECEFQIFNAENLLLKITGLRIIVSNETDFSEAIESTSEFNVLIDTINSANNFSDSVGDATNLTTEEKGSVVGAINEVNEKIWPIAQGGTGATTKKDALLNLGLTEEITKIFTGSSENSYIINVLTYVESKISLKSGVFMFNAQWEGKGYGTAIAWQSSDYIKALLLYNSVFGVRFYVWTIANSWQQINWS